MTLVIIPPITLIGDLLEIAAPAIAGLGAVRAITQIIRKQRAEQHLSSLLNEDKTRLQELEALKVHLIDSSLDAEKINKANGLLKTLVTQLGEQDQKQLMEGLSQSSERNRANYIVKLVTEGGKGSE